MKYIKPLFVVASLLPLTSLSANAELFIAPYGGYSLGGNQLDIDDEVSENSGDAKIEESNHYGIMLGMGTNDPGNIYLLLSRQSTDLTSGGLFNPDVLAPLDLDYIHLGGTLYFPQGDLNPYITASAGVTRMMPDGWSSETRFSMGIGGGAEYRLSPHWALFADVRGFATFIDNDSSLFCNADQCLWHITADVMWQVQANIGVKFSF